MNLNDKIFTTISEKAVLDERLSHSAFRLYAMLKAISEQQGNTNNTFSATLRELSELTGKGRTTLINTLNELESLGYIKRHREVGAKNAYTVIL